MLSKHLFDLTGQTGIVTGEGSRLESLMEANGAYVGRRRCKHCSMRGLRESCESDRSVRETSTCPSIGCNRL